MLGLLQEKWQYYPRPFWTLMGATFVDQLGKWMLFPFFALYTTKRFGINVTQAGGILGTFFIAGIIGKLVGGAATDRFGRRKLIIIGLLLSASTSLAMGLATNGVVFVVFVIISGLTSDIGGPAQYAAVADILPEERRQEGYSSLRIAYNLATTIGPLIGGILAVSAYRTLFILDAVSSIGAAIIVRLGMIEAIPEKVDEEPENLVDTLKAYSRIGKNKKFLQFLALTTLMVVGYLQTYAILSIYMRDIHYLSPNWYGYLLSINALMVVFLQYWLTKKFEDFPAMLMMAVGTAIMGVGLPIYALGSSYLFFVSGIVVITIGELIVVPVAQTIAINFSPGDMRGRYAASYSLTWSIANATGPILGGFVMDEFNPHLVWYLAGGVAIVAATGYLRLYLVQTKEQVAEQNPARSILGSHR